MKPSPAPLPRNVRVLGWASLLNDSASEMVYPLLPTFLVNVLGGNKAHLGLIEGVAETTASVLKLWSGGRSDVVGQRKRFVLVGYAIAIFARVLAGLSGTPWHLFGLRTADRVGKGIRTAPRDAMIADSTDATNRGRAFGYHRAMDHLGAIVGPLLATAILWFLPDQLRLLFLLTAVPGVAVLLVLATGLCEPTAASGDRPARVEWKLRSLDRRFKGYLVALGVFTLGNSSDAFLLWRAGELGVSATWLPLLWAAFHVVKSAGNLLSGRAVDRYGARPLILVGWAVYAAIYLLFAAAQTAWHAWALFLGYGIFYALTEPAEKAFVVQLVGAQRKGMAFGWFHLTIGIAALPSSVLFGVLYEWFGPTAAFGCGAVLSGLAAILLLAVTGRLHSPPASDMV